MKDGPFLNFHMDDIARVFRRFFTLNFRECDGNVALGRVEPFRSAVKDFPDARVGKALADGYIVQRMLQSGSIDRLIAAHGHARDAREGRIRSNDDGWLVGVFGRDEALNFQ